MKTIKAIHCTANKHEVYAGVINGITVYTIPVVQIDKLNHDGSATMVYGEVFGHRVSIVVVDLNEAEEKMTAKAVEMMASLMAAILI